MQNFLRFLRTNNNNNNLERDLAEEIFHSRELEFDIRYYQHQINNSIPINRLIIAPFRENINLTSVLDANSVTPILQNNMVSFPSTHIIERLFRDYIENKDKLNINEYNDNIIELYNKIDECPICYNSSDKSIKIKKCEHIFCETCIKKWLLENKNTCPTCRMDLRQ